MPASRSGPRSPHDLARQRMRRVRRLGAARGARDVNQHAPALDLDRKCRHAVRLEAGLADAGCAMELPAVPGADDVVAVETALAQRPAHMVADIRHDAELPIPVGDSDRNVARQARAERLGRKLRGTADVDPIFRVSHRLPQYPDLDPRRAANLAHPHLGTIVCCAAPGRNSAGDRALASSIARRKEARTWDAICFCGCSACRSRSSC
jgi:hypothetical protein